VANNVEVDVILASCFSYPNIISMATGMMKEITRGGGEISLNRDTNGIGLRLRKLFVDGQFLIIIGSDSFSDVLFYNYIL
jgi:hypothetical protein